jgi:hypothetical protein
VISNGEVLEAAEIPDFEGYYVTRDGRILGKADKFMVPKVEKSGHLSIRAQLKRNGKRKTKYLAIHRAVLLAWVGPCPPGMQACHNDGNPANNRVENLRWDTHAANQRDRWIHTGRRKKCEGK